MLFYKLFEEFIAACKKFDGFYKRVEISVMNYYAMDGYKITFKCNNEFLDFITSSSLDENILEIDFLYIFYSDEEYKAKLNISFRSKNFIIYYADCSSRFFPFKRNVEIPLALMVILFASSSSKSKSPSILNSSSTN